MNSALWPSPSEITPSCLESKRGKSIYSFVSKSSLRVGDLSKKENSQLFVHDARKLVISSHLVSGQLEGSFKGKKHTEEPRRKLEYVRTLLIDNYDSYTYNVFQELSIINGGKLSVSVTLYVWMCLIVLFFVKSIVCYYKWLKLK